MTEEAELAPSWLMKGVPEGGALEGRGCRSKARRVCPVLLPATGSETSCSGGRRQTVCTAWGFGGGVLLAARNREPIKRLQ